MVWIFHIWPFQSTSSKLRKDSWIGFEMFCVHADFFCLIFLCSFQILNNLSDLRKNELLCCLKFKPCLVFFSPLSAEDEAVEFGGMEEHPWSSSLGGLQGVPGAAAQQAEQERLRSRAAGRADCCSRTEQARVDGVCGEGAAETKLPQTLLNGLNLIGLCFCRT